MHKKIFKRTISLYHGNGTSMSLHRFEKKIKIEEKFEQYYAQGFYTGSIGKMTQSRTSEIILLTYDGKLMVLSDQGQKKLEIPFSNNVCRIFIEDLFQKEQKVFISLAYNGEIRVFDDTGKIFWKMEIKDIVDGFLGNLDYDEQKEIVVLQKPNKVIILNNLGKQIAKYTHPNPISFISHAKINSKNKYIVLIADRKNKLFALDVEDTIEEIPIHSTIITGLDSLSIYDQNVLILLTHNNELQLLDKKGSLIEHFTPKRKVEALFTGYFFDDKIESIVLLSEDSYVMVYQISVADASNFIDIKAHSENSNIQKTFQTDQISKNPSLEFDPQYFHSHQKAPITPEKKLKERLKKTVKKPKQPENIEVRCPECGDFFTPTIINRLIQGKTAYCEECGLEIHKKDFPNVFH